MIIGDPEVFAIESVITKAYERLSFRALGYFVLDVAGRSYGVKESDATLLACSLDEVSRRLARRGSHNPHFPIDASAGEIAYAFRRAGYAICEENERFFGMAAVQFGEAIYAKHLEWAPDGDEAFDDGSYVLQIEDMKRVRLIAYVSTPDNLYDPATLRDVWLSSHDFYNILQSWRDLFEAEWIAAPKSPDGN
jgi:Immunity protein 42